VGVAPLVVKDPKPEEVQRIERYTREFTDAVEQVAVDAAAARVPSRLSWAEGTVGFAINRRVLKDGKWTKIGEVPDGPVDHSLPMLAVTDESGKLRGVLVNYACHCTTLRLNGDWAGYAQEFVERDHPGAIAMVAIGCGADSNPSPRGEIVYAQQHGEAISHEVKRLLASTMTPMPAVSQARAEVIALPFDTPPTREEFEARAKLKGGIAVHAALNLARLDRGEALATSLPYRVQAWEFGPELAMVFLSGEVVGDYARRLKSEAPGRRLWINAYSNDVLCYIASKRVLAEGGYEVDSSMYYFDKPTHFTPAVEDMIVSAVRRLLMGWFASGSSKWESAIAAFEEQDRTSMPAPGGIVFVGSSTIRKWELDKWFPELPVLNRGFGGSHLSDSVEFAPRIVSPYKPRTVVVYAGDNDLGAGKTPEQVASDFKALVAVVRKDLPDTRILYLSIKPSIKRWSIVEKGRETNRRIEEFMKSSGDQKLEFVDVTRGMLGDDGQPRKELFVADGLHMSDEGYRLWSDELRGRLKE
jgi:lysophospholipase L1-like esterase